MKHLAIIPARSGSRGLPGKNIRLLHGHPLLAWSIVAAQRSGLFDRVILSTDSEEYAAIGNTYGADTPWLRKPELAEDETSSADVVSDILERLEIQGEAYEYFTLVQPTSPLRTAEDLQGAWNLLVEKSASSVVGVSPCDHPPQWSGLLPENLSMESFLQPQFTLPRQKLPVYYRVNGAVYMAATAPFLHTKRFIGPGTYAWVMPHERSVDIDDETDFMLAGLLMQKMNYLI